MPRPRLSHPSLFREPAGFLALAGLAFGVLTGQPAIAERQESDPPRLRYGVESIEPRHLLGQPPAASGRFTGLHRPLDRSAQAASEDRLSWGRSFTSYYPLDTGLWAGVPSGSLSGVRGGIGAGELVDVHFSIGRPAGASGDPDVRSMWHSNATAVDHDALARALHGGVASPLEATNLRQLQRATVQSTAVSTAALSRPATQSASISQSAIPYQPRITRLRLPDEQPASSMDSGPPADSMEHPVHRRNRLRAIAERVRHQHTLPDGE